MIFISNLQLTPYNTKAQFVCMQNHNCLSKNEKFHITLGKNTLKKMSVSWALLNTNSHIHKHTCSHAR